MKDQRQIVLSDFGKIPPQSIDAEESVLGTCLVYPDSVHGLRLIPEMFYKDAHQKIFKSILEVAGKSKCDLVTITENLRFNNELESVGGPVYITKLTQNVFTDQYLDNHALLVREKYILREYIRISAELQNMAFQEDLSDVSEYAETSLFKLSDFTQTKEPKKISLCIDELLVEVEKIYTKEKSLIGVPSGFTSIDRITGGFQPGNLIVIAGRPSMGKTALALTLCSNSSKLKYPICLFSLEMSESEISARFLSSVSGYSNVQIRNAEINMEKLAFTSNDVAVLPIFIDDTPALGLMELRSKVKKMIIRYGVKMIVIDYLQLMKANAGNREQEVSVISRGLKAISKEFKIPVIALSQLNRGVEDRNDKRPRLADLRESGAIEQDADIVMFVYRPNYYNLKTIMLNNEEISTNGLMLIDCAKDRNGALFSIPLYHNESLTVIQDKKFELHNEPY
jgi:replicative DNA helicase